MKMKLWGKDRDFAFYKPGWHSTSVSKVREWRWLKIIIVASERKIFY